MCEIEGFSSLMTAGFECVAVSRMPSVPAMFAERDPEKLHVICLHPSRLCTPTGNSDTRGFGRDDEEELWIFVYDEGVVDRSRLGLGSKSRLDFAALSCTKSKVSAIR